PAPVAERATDRDRVRARRPARPGGVALPAAARRAADRDRPPLHHPLAGPLRAAAAGDRDHRAGRRQPGDRGEHLRSGADDPVRRRRLRRGRPRGAPVRGGDRLLLVAAVLGGGPAAGRSCAAGRPAGGRGEHGEPGHGGHPGGDRLPGSAVHRRVAARDPRRDRHRDRDDRGDRVAAGPAARPGRPAADAVGPAATTSTAVPTGIRTARLDPGCSGCGGGEMNLFREALAWLFAPEQQVGADSVLTRLGEHLLYTAIAVVISAVIAIPIGYWIGHTGRGKQVAVAFSGAARALPSLGLLTILTLLVGVGDA